MRRTTCLIMLVLLLGAFTANPAGTVRMAFFRVNEEAAGMTVTWQVELEEGVRTYELLRRTRFTNDRFVSVASLAPHGAGRSYTVRDDQIFKASAEQVDYLLEVVYTDGLREQLAQEQVNYTSTAIRRTWGSIKAMFQ